eukprot:3072028-Amphidinium_carterae.1
MLGTNPLPCDSSPPQKKKKSEVEYYTAHSFQFWYLGLGRGSKDNLLEVFERNALVDDESLADAQGICSALAECGISGHSFEDRVALQDYCEEILRGALVEHSPHSLASHVILILSDTTF